MTDSQLTGFTKSRSDLVDSLKRASKISKNHGLTFEVLPALRQLKKFGIYLETVGGHNSLHGAVVLSYDYLWGVWVNTCSFISGFIHLEHQEEFIVSYGEYLARLSDILVTDENLNEALGEASKFKRAYEKITQKARKNCNRLECTKIMISGNGTVSDSSNDINKKIGVEGGFAFERLSEGKAKVVKHLLQSGALHESIDPIFLLKNGYRSFHFFDGSSIVRKTDYSDSVYSELSRLIPPDYDALITGCRAFGETDGALQLQSALVAVGEKRGVNMVMNVETTGGWGIQPLPSLNNPRKACFIDDVVTTGATLDSWVSKCKEERVDLAKYITFIDRRVESSKQDSFEYESIISGRDLLASRVWKPEILLCDVDRHGDLLSAIDFCKDYLREMCIYFDVEDGYDQLAESLDKLIVASESGENLLSDPHVRNFHRNMYLLYCNEIRSEFLAQSREQRKG